MTIASEIATIISPIVAVLITAICILKILEIRKVQEELNSAIVLVPLFKKRTLIVIALGICSVIVITSIVIMFTQGYVIAMLGILVSSLSVIALMVTLSRAKFAVLDSGVLLPYKFVEWSELYDYIINEKENSVMFTGNSHGHYTLSSTSIMMSFNSVDRKKLEQILSKNKLKHKVKLG